MHIKLTFCQQLFLYLTLSSVCVIPCQSLIYKFCHCINRIFILLQNFLILLKFLWTNEKQIQKTMVHNIYCTSEISRHT